MTALREPSPLQARLAAARRAHAEPSAGIPRWTGAAPLSPAQARLWFMAQLEPGSSAYNAPALLRLRGQLDDAAMLAALRDLAERHPVLRSVVEDREGGPVAVPVEPDAVPLRAAAVADGALDEAVRAETERPFALDAEPPMRAALFRLPGGDEHVLALTLHHIVTDAWSGNLLLADLAALYAARLGLGDVPAAPAVQYADYAAWLAEGHESDRTAAAVDWWAQRLAGLAPALELPVDRPRRPGADASAARITLDLPEPLTARVRTVAAERRCTPFVVLLAAWQELLGRVCATDDVPVAVPESGRHRAETEAAVGCFINTLVIRTDTSGDPTGHELIDRVRDGVLDSFAHAAAPFEQVVARLNPERTPGTTPLAHVQLNVYDAPADPRFAGLATELSEAPAETAKYDLSLTLVDAGATFAGGLVYKRALFDERTAARLAEWYRHVLDGMLADLDRPVGAVALEPNPAPLLVGPARRWPDDRSVRALIEAQVDVRPDATAVIAPDGVLSYAELERRANRIAHRLRAAGVVPDQPVGVLLEPSTALACALLGILKAGGGYLPMDATYPAGRIAGILETAGAHTLLTTAELADRGAGRTVIALDDPASLAGQPSERPEPVAGPDHLAHVIFTSGSTGAPKGVAQTNRSVANYLHGVLERLGDVAGGSFAMVSTPAADFGLTPIFGALTTGGCLHLVDREVATDPAAFARYLAEHPLDVLKCVPSHLELLATHGELADVLPRRLLILAGEACPWSLVERVHAARPGLRVQNHYGHTESTMISLVCETGELPAGQRDGVVPLGTPLANVTGYIVDRAGRPLPAGVPGELIVTGPGVARGYVGRPDLTAERFVPDPVSGARGYRSGDRIRVRLDGAVEFLGRVDDQVKIRGYRVEPGEVVAALRALPGVREAVVLAVGEGRERKLAAWLVGDELDVAAMRARLRERLPDYMVPASFVLLDRLPLTPNGKIDRAALPAPVADRSAARRAPSTPAEARVAAAWGDVLGVDDVGADDDFFALGGDSFAAVRAVRAIDPALRVIDLFTHPTVQQLGAFLDARDGGAAGGLLHRLGGPTTAVATLIGVPYGGGSAAAFQPLAAPLAERGIALLAAELPGHDPARPDEAPLGLAELVDRLAEEVAEGVSGPVAVYGHCVGSAVATALARRLEADGRIVLGAIAGGSFPAAPLPGRLSALASRVFGERWVSDRLYRDALLASGGVTDDMDEAATTVALRAMRHDAHEAQEWFGAQLEGAGPKLRAPLLCLVGERDSQTELYAERYREWGAFAERVELAAIPRAGHYFLRHQGVEVAELLAERLEDWAAGRLPEPVRDVPVERGGLRRFYTVAAGQLVSNVGSALTAFALGVWAYQRSGRIVDLALVIMLAQLPAVLATPLGGALADRLDRRRIMLACDAVSGLAMAALVVLLATDRLALWSVLLVVGVTSLVTAVQQPAWLAAISQLAPKPYLPQANALANLGRSFGNIVAPLAGGVLVATVGLSAVVAIDVASFGVGLVTLLAVRFPDRLFRPRVESFRSSVSGGWRFIKRRRPLVVMVVFVAAANYFNAVLWVAVTPLVLSFAGPAGLGVVTAVGGAGAALGGIAVLVWGGTRRRATGMVGFVLGSGVGTILMGLWPSVAVVAIGLAVRWGSMAISNAHWLSLIQVKVGPELQGRVLATNLMLVTVMEPLGFLTASPLADLLGVSALVLASGAFLTVWGLLGLRYRPLRYMEDALPDAVLGAEIDDDLDCVQARVDLAWAT